jgi:hypothetical protein
MIKLFEEKINFINSFVDNNEIVFNVELNKQETIKIDWNKCQYGKVTINFSGSGLVTLLEANEPNKIKVIYNLLDYSRVNHSIANFSQGNDECSYEVNLGEGSEYRGALADFSYGKKKFDFVCNLNKPYSKANWNLASLTTENDSKTYYVSFYHHAKHTYAKMENYGVCEDESSLNFFGTSSIERGAKTSATHQSAKIMVFDEKCKAKASPILCIDENDVEASHAAVVGQINEDHIFYLTSRGIEEDEAKKLITLGYLNPILKFFDDEDTLNEIKNSIERRF